MAKKKLKKKVKTAAKKAKKPAKKAAAPKTKKKKVVKATNQKTSAAKKAKKVAAPKAKTQSLPSKSLQSLQVGSEVPSLVLQDSQGHSHDLAGFKGQKVVLYFYPKDDTPGCTLEGQQFTQLYSEFQKLNTVVFGISRDSVQSHDKFKCKYNFGVELLSDSDEKACQLFDVIKEKNMYGKIVLGIERSTFILNEEGKIVKEYRKVTADGHAAQVLEDIKSL